MSTNTSSSSSSSNNSNNDGSQISHVINKDKKYLSDHGQKLFNAINVLLDDQEQLELTQALFKYQKEHNVFTLVRCCRELFDTPRKKSLMLFMRPVIPVRDRFHYDEYYKLFFPDEFASDVKSIFADLIPKDLIEKTVNKANEKRKMNQEKEKERERQEQLDVIKTLEKANFDLNLDLQKLINNKSHSGESGGASDKESNVESDARNEKQPSEQAVETKKDEEQQLIENSTIKIAGFRIIELSPNENESLGFDVCLGPTSTFIMISYVEPGSLVEKLGMKAGDELVSVNEISFKMMDVDQAIDILSSEANLRIVLQTSGFLPERADDTKQAKSPNENGEPQQVESNWIDPFGRKVDAPSEDKQTLKRHIRRLSIRPVVGKNIGFKFRGGFENALGVFVSDVDIDSAADKAGLKVSDQIIEINGQSLNRKSLEDTLRILRNGILTFISNESPIKLTVRYLGKIPIKSLSNKLPLNDRSIDLEKKSESNAQIYKVLNENEFLLCEEMIKLRLDINNLAEMNQLKSSSSLSSSSSQSQSSNNKLESIRNLFKSATDFNLFKYYINEYHNSRISIQYLFYLLINYISNGHKLLLSNENSKYLAVFIHKSDMSIFNKFLAKLNDDQSTISQLSQEEAESNEDFMESSINQYVKNSLLTKSIDFADLKLDSFRMSQCENATGSSFTSEDFKIKIKKPKHKSLDDLKYLTY